MWTITEFVEILNKKLPLSSFKTDNDKRKSNEWSVRLLREYLYMYKISGIKSGKYVLYNEENLNELKAHLEGKFLFDSLSKANSYSSATEYMPNKTISGSLSSSLMDKTEDSLESILRKSKRDLNIPQSSVSQSLDFFNSSNKRSQNVEYSINISPDIKIVVNDFNISNKEVINEIKKWFKKIGE